MNENKRLITIFVIIILIVGVILLISFWPKPDKTFICGAKADGDYKMLGKVDYKQYQCLYKSKSKNAIVVADKLNKNEKANLNDTAKKLGHALYYLDVENISNEDMKIIKKELKYRDESFKKDVIIIIKNKKIDSYKEDILDDKKALYDFTEKANLAKFACGVNATEEYKNLGEITYEQYQCLYESEKAFILVLEQTTCGYCQQFNPIIGEYAEKNNTPIYIMQIDTLEDADRTALTNSLSYFDGNDSWGTPLTLGIKNKEVLADISGFTEDTAALDDVFEKINK